MCAKVLETSRFLMFSFTCTPVSVPKLLYIQVYTLTAGVRDDNGRSPLDLALDEGSEDDGRVGLYLIKHHGWSDEQDKAKLLYKACKWGRLDVVKELIEQHNVDPNCEYITCFDFYNVHEPLRNSSTLRPPITI